MKTILGTGQLGQTLLDLLLADNPGQALTLVNRSGRVPFRIPAHVQVRAADVTDAASLRSISRTSDVLFSCTDVPYPQWEAFYPAAAHALTDALRHSDAKLVFADNLYSYGNTKGGQMHENTPPQAHTRKGRIRRRVVDELWHSAPEVKARIAVVKAADFIGARIHKGIFGTDFLKNLYAGKPVYLFGRIDAPHTFTYINDFARAMINVSKAADAFGEIWHVPNAPAESTRNWLKRFETASGQPARLMVPPKAVVRALGLFNPLVREMIELAYQFEYPYLVSHRKYESRFGNHATGADTIVAETIRWYQTELNHPGIG
jgi:nucleoside-diphosphate-sugar epimerase